MFKKLVAIALLAFAFFGNGVLDLLDVNLVPDVNPEPTAIIEVEKPSDEILNSVVGFGKLITDPTDRAKIAIFNYEFANRITRYATDLQQVNDIYALAGKHFFNQTLVDKYDGFSEMIVKTIERSCGGSDNHILSEKEKQTLKNNFLGISWVLIQR